MADKVVPVDVRALVVAWPDDAPRGAVARFVAEHGVSRSWFYEVRKRAVQESAIAAMGPRARIRPVVHPQAVAIEVEELAVRIRKELTDAGWDHGPLTVRHKLLELGVDAPAASTLARIFTRHAMVTAQPQKRPRSSYRRFEADAVHECWQLDAFEHTLADATKVAVFQLLDDHSRYMIATHVGPRECAQDALKVVAKGIAAHQVPCRLLSDNGTAFNRDRMGTQTQLVAYLRALGCMPITGRPRHPQTQGKDERVHQTLQRWLTAQTRTHGRATTIAELQASVDVFDEHYNNARPHQSLRMRTPAQSLSADPRAIPPLPPTRSDPAPKPATPTAMRQRTVDRRGLIKLQSITIMIGYQRRGAVINVVSCGRTLSLFDAQGTHFRNVELVPGQNYYGNGQPRGGARTRKCPD